jgi:hypothetical protein
VKVTRQVNALIHGFDWKFTGYPQGLWVTLWKKAVRGPEKAVLRAFWLILALPGKS